MPEEPPSILPRGTIIRPSASPRPAPPASPVYIQSVSGFSCSDATAAGIDSSGGGGPPASTSATRTDGSSDSRAAITAPADPPPTTTTSNCCSATASHLSGSRPHHPVGDRWDRRRSMACVTCAGTRRSAAGSGAGVSRGPVGRRAGGRGRIRALRRRGRAHPRDLPAVTVEVEKLREYMNPKSSAASTSDPPAASAAALTVSTSPPRTP